METENRMNQEININFEHIRDHCGTIAEILILERGIQKETEWNK